MNEQQTLLFQACLKPWVTPELIERLHAAGSSLDHLCDYGDNMLLNCCYNRSLTLTLLKFVLGLNFSTKSERNRLGYTALHIVCHVRGKHFQELFDHLLSPEVEADIDARDKYGHSPLYQYCEAHRIDVTTLRMFCDKGAKIDRQVFLAIVERSDISQPDLLSFLFDHLDPGEFPLSPARKRDYGNESFDGTVMGRLCDHNCACVQDHVIKKFLAYGFTLQGTSSLWTPLTRCCRNLQSTADQIRCLISNGASLDETSSSGVSSTPRSILLEVRGEEGKKILLELEGQPNI